MDGTADPQTNIIPSSITTEICLGSGDRRGCNGHQQLQGFQPAFRNEGNTDQRRGSAPNPAPLRNPEAGLSMGNSTRVSGDVEGNQPSKAIVDTRRITHSINEKERRKDEKERIDTIVGLLPSELLVNLRMRNSKPGHTKLQVLDAAVQFLEALPDDVKQWAMQQCRRNLAKGSHSHEHYCKAGGL